MSRINKSKSVWLIITTILFFGACGNNNNNADNKTVNDSLPPDLAAISQRIQEDPENAVLYDERAKLYLQKQKPEGALADINKAITIDSKNPVYYRTLSDVYFMMGKAQRSREALDKAIEVDQDDTSAYLKLAELEFYYKEYKKSFDYIEKALRLDPKNAKAFFIRGMAYKEMGDTTKAVKAFQMAVDFDQEYYHAYMQLGLLFSVKHNPLAVDYYNNALSLNPQSTETYYALGLYYQQNEQYNKAIESYTSLLKIDPKNKFAHFNLGYIHLVYLQVYDVAAKHFTDAINSDKNYAEAWYNRGYCFELLGDVMNAKNDYQQAIMLRPNYQRAIDGQNRIDDIIKK